MSVLRPVCMPIAPPLLVGKNWMARRHAGREAVRRALRPAHVVDWYDSKQDPHAALLAQAMPRFGELYDVRMRRFEVPLPQPPLVAGPEREAGWRALDAAMISPQSGLKTPALNPPAGSDQQLQQNAKRQRSKGHFAPKVLHYGGDWYRGVDRLALLEARLQKAGARSGHAAPRDDSCDGPFDTSRPVGAFVSIRSPYSAIATARLTTMRAAGMTVRYRPVLPMSMRGLPVPGVKRFRILFDAAREAHERGVPFGRICDPVSVRIERAMAIYPLAHEAGRGGDLLRVASHAVWADGINLATDRGLRLVCERAQVGWQQAARTLTSDGWRTLAGQNRTNLLTLGLWGLPCSHVPAKSTWDRGFATWAQDRLWLLPRELR